MPADQALMDKIKRILKAHFGEDYVDVSRGYGENVHVLVVSRKFDALNETFKQDYLWDLIDKNPEMTEEEKLKISMILPFSPDELK